MDSSLPDDSPAPRTRRPTTVDDLTQRNVDDIARLEAATDADTTRMDEAARRISEFGGSPRFVWLHVLLFSLWIGVNTLAPFKAFDPYPFTFLTLVVSLEAIFLSAFILMSQNRDARLAERRNQLDLQLNLLTEQETTRILALLELVARKVGVEHLDALDPPLQVLEQATRPEKLAEQIARVQERKRQ